MTDSVATPLQLWAGVGMYSGNAITANTALATNIAAYNALAPITNLLTAISLASGNVGLGITAGTLANLKSIGASVSGNFCPALGDSVPSNVSLTVGNAGYATSVTTAANTYLGGGDFGKFAQAFGAAQGYISLTNGIINSAVNVNSDDFLGPTYSGMDNLISGDIAKVNLAFPAFGADLANIGGAVKFTRVDQIGTPASLLQNLAEAGNMINGSTPCVTTALQAQGLSDQNIADLVNNNVQSLFNPNGLTANQFDVLQKAAYPALVNVGGDCLTEVLSILDCTTPNIATMADLLNPVKLYPTSFSSLTLPTPDGPVLIYNTDGSVNSAVEQILNSGTVTPKGCDDLAKIVPSAQAQANRALQIAYQQVKGIRGTTTQQLAAILQ
jgi:hypothetical protein